MTDDDSDNLIRELILQVSGFTAQLGRVADAIEAAVKLASVEQDQKKTWEPEHYRRES